jgi:hypothetical protein
VSAESPDRSDRRAAIAAWSSLTAPGALVAAAIIALALLAANVCTPLIVVAPAVCRAAAVLLFLHGMITLALALWPDRCVVASLFLGLLMADAFLCGLTVNGDWRGPAPLLVLAVIVMSLEAGGWLAVAASTVAAGAGALAAAWCGVGATVLMPTPRWFPTTMAVETSFAGDLVMTVPVAPFPTMLSVETSIAGLPAFNTAEELFLPTLGLVLVALCLGLTTTTWRVRRARTAVAASIVTAARVLPC